MPRLKLGGYHLTLKIFLVYGISSPDQNKNGFLKMILIGLASLLSACENHSPSFVAAKLKTASSQIITYPKDSLDGLYQNVNLNTSSSFQIKKFDEVGKIWGFLKYYHPAVAAGKFDWDKEVCFILPKPDSCSSAEKFNALLTNWLKRLLQRIER